MATILDHRGNPVNSKNLTMEIATASVGGVRQPIYEAVNSLTPERMSCILKAIIEGDATEYLTLAEQMEERDLHYASVLRTSQARGQWSRNCSRRGQRRCARRGDCRRVPLADEAPAIPCAHRRPARRAR